MFTLLFHMGGFTFLAGSIPQAERDALITLYYSTGGDNWSDKTNWLDAPGSENTWFGVTVVTINSEDHVTGISLINNNLTGTVPAEIAIFTRLEYLSLDHNHLSGTVPREISTLTRLKRLVLDNNQLTGGIPPGFDALEKLESLGLNHNQLQGPIPVELGNLYNLEKLHLASNCLVGSIPTSLTRLVNLTSLEVGFNGLYTSDSGLKAFLDGKSPGWQDTQTISPGIESVEKLTDSSIEVKWTPIAFTMYEGYYEILYRTGLNPEGQYDSLGKTGDKSAASMVINNFNMIPGTTYYFVTRTKTFPHENNANDVLSESSPEYEMMEAGCTVTVRTEPEAGGYITVSPADSHGESSGAADFTRTYAPGTTVTLTAVEQLNNNPFRQWKIQGAVGLSVVYRREITVVMDSDLTVTAVYKRPEIYFTPTYFNFGGTADGVSTPAQEFLISNRGGGTLEWVIADNTPSWLIVTPTAGSCSGGGSEFVTVAVNTRRLDEERYEGFITISAAAAANSPQELKVILNVIDDSEDRLPFGSFDIPADHGTVAGSIAISGWALDDIGINRVKLYSEDTGAAPGELVYIGDAVFIEGARPDVEAAYPGYPLNHKAGWGYMMLTNALNPRQNPAKVFKIHVVITAADEEEVSLGAKTVIIDNRDAVKPFGAMDLPGQGGIASGSSYRNQGWVLAPPGHDPANPDKIPEDGSTIVLYLDGKKQEQGAAYDIFRADIAALFPGYANSEGAQAEFVLDTTVLANGLHTISWTAEDSAGHMDGIGSRFFTVRNTAAADTEAAFSMNSSTDIMNPLTGNLPPGLREEEINNIPVNFPGPGPIEVKKRDNRDAGSRVLFPGKNNAYNVEMEVPGRLEIHFPSAKMQCRYSGYLTVGDCLKPLPAGSTLDTVKGVFYWQVGAGFYGTYELVFLRIDLKNKSIIKIPVNVEIAK